MLAVIGRTDCWERVVWVRLILQEVCCGACTAARRLSAESESPSLVLPCSHT